MDVEIIAKFCTSLFYWKLNQNYNKIRGSIEMKSKQQNKICRITKTKFVVFYYKVPTTIFTPQNYMSHNEIFFPRTPIFGQSQATSSWFKTNKNLKFKPTMFHDQSLFQMPCSSKPCNHFTPLTIFDYNTIA